MIQLRCTGNAQKALGLKPVELSPITHPASTLGNWYVNIFTVDRRKTFIFMNEKTLLSFVIFGIKKSNIGRTPDIFLSGLSQLLALQGITPQQIQRVISEYQEMEFTKTDSRSILGNLNELVATYKHYILYDGGFKYCDLGEIILRVNQMPQRNLGWDRPAKMIHALLNDNFRA